MSGCATATSRTTTGTPRLTIRQGPTQPSPYRVLRGGCWSSHRAKIRAAYRNYDEAEDRHLEIGFRCILRP